MMVELYRRLRGLTMRYTSKPARNSQPRHISNTLHGKDLAEWKQRSSERQAELHEAFKPCEKR